MKLCRYKDQSKWASLQVCWKPAFYLENCGRLLHLIADCLGKHNFHNGKPINSHGSSSYFVALCVGRTCSLWIWWISTRHKQHLPTITQLLQHRWTQSFDRIGFHSLYELHIFQQEWDACRLGEYRIKTWSWESKRKKNEGRYELWDHVGWNRQSFLRVLICIIMVVPDSSVNKMCSVIDHLSTLGILHTNLHEFL